MGRKLTKEEIVEKCILRNGYTYSYDKVAAEIDDITVTCSEHGDFLISKKKHMHRGDGCPKCSGKGMATQDVISRFKEVHGDLYSYEKYEFTTSHSKSIVTCLVHGDFSVTYANHFHNKVGCPVCGGKQLKTTAQFIQDAIKANPSKNYDYSSVNYINDYSKVKVVCKEHGEFNITASNHLQGQGCKKCSKNGFNPAKEAILYILKSKTLTKVGITNRELEARLKEINKGSKQKFEPIFFQRFSNGKIANDIETELLRDLRKSHKSSDDLFTGHTECFTEVNTDALIIKALQLYASKQV